jgi:hypothetical protein
MVKQKSWHQQAHRAAEPALQRVKSRLCVPEWDEHGEDAIFELSLASSESLSAYGH